MAAACFLFSCGGDEPSQGTKKDDEAAKPSVFVPEPTKHYEGTPYWLVQSKNWPPLLEWELGPDGEHTYDSLSLRLSGTVIQSFVSGPKSKDHPIMCWLDLTVRPIPKQLVGYTYRIDSVVFHDPVKSKTLPALPMLSLERYTEAGVVRTRFSNNLSFVYTPDLVENQPLQPIVYVTSVDKKSIKIKMPPMNVSFLTELKQEEIPLDSMKWGPS
jgi:hypothetical protein